MAGTCGKKINKRRRSDSCDCGSICSKCKNICSANENPMTLDKDGGLSTSGTEYINFSIRGPNCSCHYPLIIPSLGVPRRLSEWKRAHIENLNISILYTPNTKPLNLIECGENVNYEDAERMLELKKYVQKSPVMAHLRYLDHSYTSFSKLSSANLWEMSPNDDEQISLIPPWLPEKLMLWFYRFNCEAHNFVNQLYMILKRKDNGCSVQKTHLQSLFEAFTAMFGLKSWLSSVPCLHEETCWIRGNEVCGGPDIIFPCKMFSPFNDVKKGTQHPRVVAICEVKRESPNINHSSDNSPGSSRMLTQVEHKSNGCTGKIADEVSPHEHDSSVFLQHLDNSLIGQHGGKLLFHYPATMKNGRICGMIVQETQVTFTVLEMTDDQYREIVEDKINYHYSDPPKFKITRPYDYLKTQDREFIVEAFIKLAMLQRKIK